MFGQGSGGGGFDMSKVNPMAVVVAVMILISAALVLNGDTFCFQKPAVNAGQKIVAIPVFLAYKITGDRTSADALTGTIYIAILGGLGFWGWKLIKIKLLEPMQMKELAEETDRKEKLINMHRKQ